MTNINMKWSRELKAAGSKLGREGLSILVLSAVRDFDGSYKGAMVLAGRLKAVAQAAKFDSYWSEKVDDGFMKQRDIILSERGLTAILTSPSSELVKEMEMFR